MDKAMATQAQTDQIFNDAMLMVLIEMVDMNRLVSIVYSAQDTGLLVSAPDRTACFTVVVPHLSLTRRIIWHPLSWRPTRLRCIPTSCRRIIAPGGMRMAKTMLITILCRWWLDAVVTFQAEAESPPPL